ncbi:MAG TPA: hypothetical protein VEL76_10635, partial [Gemmataceae bacterium]|nr:hypothetical protein [Gemmataceae bacterium]
MARLHAPLLALSCLILVATGRGETFPEPSPASVTALAFAPDGKTLATGGTDRSVRLWDVSTGRELRCLVGHKEAIFTVLFLPDGKTLVSGSKDGAIILWDATTGEQLRRLVHLQQPLDGLALSADGKLMASVGFRAVALWDMPAGQFLRRMEFDGRSVRQATFLPDGKQLAVVSWDASILIGGIAEGKVLRILKVNTGNDAALHGIRVVGNTFLVGDTRGKAHLYDPVKAE